MNLKNEELKRCIETLSKLSENPSLIADLTEEERITLFKAAGIISRPNRDQIRLRNKTIRKQNHKKVSQFRFHQH